MVAKQLVLDSLCARSAFWSCAVLLLASTSCASINFSHVRVDTAPEKAAVAQAVAGQTDLEKCLNLLGAPTSVEPSETGQRFILTWNWLEQEDWGFSLSIPLGDQSASFNWKDSESQPQFVRLFFDANWRLVDKAEG